MKRRNALKTISLAAGSSLVLPPVFFASCQRDDYQPVFFTKEEIALLNEIGNTILPTTEDSAGAKDINIAHFMDKYVAECYPVELQAIVKGGVNIFQKECMTNQQQVFQDWTKEQKHIWLVQMDEEVQKEERTIPHYFSLIKKLVLFGYFTSEEGMTKALRFVPIPGKYEGSIPYQVGEKVWAL